MKIMIVGAGIIGTIYGWAFAEAGHEVIHLVRPGRAAQFGSGIEIDMYDVRKGHKRDFLGHYPIQVTESILPSPGFDLVIVPTKHYHLVETLRQIVPQTGGADYWLLVSPIFLYGFLACFSCVSVVSCMFGTFFPDRAGRPNSV